MADHSNGSLSPNKAALLKIRQLKAQLAQAQANAADHAADRYEPIAIVSMACRFPRQSNTPEKFWQSLIDRADQVGEIPDDRWDLDAFHDDDPNVPGKMYARSGVFLDNIDRMDPEFFGISPREATWVDPQQRLLLETGWEALERAGWTPEQIGPSTGVFVGWMHNDYQNEASDSFLNLNPYIATGAAGSFLCGRLAYYLGLEGPSLATDTACSSSLVALHLACQSLQRRECDHALVGGVNVICSPTTNILTCKLQALSPQGHSRAFDAAADGYLRGEGCGVVTIRRLADAERDGDSILGVIRGSAVGHNGFSSGLTAPNPRAQEKVIRQALDRAQIEPDEVAYLEAHGTGTELGDPIEMRAAAAALSGARDADNPLLVGSVKTNIGHLEAAAGMAGLIKVLLSIENDEIPGQLNFETPNPHIAWDQMPVRVLTDRTPWPSAPRRIAGVSAFGMSGTNAHVVIESPAQPPGTPKPSTPINAAASQAVSDRAELIVLTGTHPDAVDQWAEDLGNHLATEATAALGDVAYTSSIHRKHFEHRIAVVASSVSEARSNLAEVARGVTSDNAARGNGRRTPKVAWQFTGQGSQYLGMGRDLYDHHPIFRQTIDDCDQTLGNADGISLCEVLFANESLIHHTRWTQPCIFAVQRGLVALLDQWGIQPDVVMGHSVGQFAAACVAGIMSWDDGLRLIAKRGQLIGDLPPGGSMLAVFESQQAVVEHLERFDELSLAAFNATHIVVSGADEAIDAMAIELEKSRIRCKKLQTSHAFHSSLMEPALEPFARFADSIAFQPAKLPLICNVAAEVLPPDRTLDGNYWADHIRQPVQFAGSIGKAQDIGCEVMLEVGPQPVLTNMATAAWQGAPDRLISCLKKGANDHRSMLRAVGRLFVQGIEVDFAALHQDQHRRRVMLPTYPFQRRRYWGPDKPRAAHAEFHTAHPLLGGKLSLAGSTGETRYESFIEPDSPSWLPDHEVMDQIVVPGAALVELALAAAENGQLNDVIFEQPLRPTGRTALQTIVRKADGLGDEDAAKTLESFSSTDAPTWTRNFVAKVTPAATAKPPALDLDQLKQQCDHHHAPSDFYQKMHEIGLHYGPKFRTVDELSTSDTAVLAHLRADGDVRGFTIPPTLLDGALHSLAVGLLKEDDGSLFLPVGMKRVQAFGSVENEMWSYARWTEPDGKIRTADLTLADASGNVVAVIEELKVQQISRAALRKINQTGPEQFAYQIDWQPMRLPTPTSEATRWLLIESTDRHQSEDQSIARPLRSQLEQRGHQVVTVQLQSGASWDDSATNLIVIDGSDPEHWDRLFDRAFADDPSIVPDGIAWLCDVDPPVNSEEIFSVTRQNCDAALRLVHCLQRRNLRSIRCGIQWITADAIQTGQDAVCRADQTLYWGLGRVVGAEQPEYRCRLIDLSSAETDRLELAGKVASIMLAETPENQMAVRDGRFVTPQMRRSVFNNKPSEPFAVHADRSYLITGGLGMLGREAAKWLADRGAGQVVLVSRREPDESTQAFLDSISQSGCKVVVRAADMGSRPDVEAMFDNWDVDQMPLAGVIHAAGLLDDATIGDQDWDRFERVLTPKLGGAALLHELTQSLELDFFVLYSSAASVLGSPGQSNYATANAYLDGLAWQRRAMGLPALSINWGPWSAGMADDPRILKRMALQGIVPLSVDDAHRVIERMLSADHSQTLVMDVDWRRMQVGLGSQAMLQSLVPKRGQSQTGDSELVSQLKKLRGSARRERLFETITGLLQRILSTSDAPDPDRPLVEMGLDSLMAVEFGAELQQMLGDQFEVGPTMLFDHPSITAITDHVLELLAEVAGQDDSQPTATVSQTMASDGLPTQREPIAIIGMSCRFPGAKNVDEFWDNLINRVDSVGEIPSDRWDVDRFYSPDGEPGKMVSKQGGFLDDIGDFDAAFFNISDTEACWIDPQHRMLLENSYHALEDAGIATHPLADRNVGVFMGIMGNDYAFLPQLENEEIITAFQGAGLSHSAGVGRISYAFGFEGPSVSVDTASSSSLVALDQAVRNLQDGNCNLALAGGVNAILAPVNSLLMSKAGLMAPDGRCKSFSADANGFGRGEGCGVVVLKRLSDAQRDGDRIMAVVRGGAVVHNGVSSGITAPNGKSQSRAINEALSEANIAPSQVQYLEAHGTGTEYGDPMELGAAASVYGKGRRRERPLLVGSVKGNISHLEAAGGVSGLIKTVLSLYRGIIPPQVHFDQPSPHIAWKRLPVKIVTEATEWPEVEERFAAVTALGLVGTNAHVVLSGPPEIAPAPEDHQDAEATRVAAAVSDDRSPPEQLLTLSARTPSALCQLAKHYTDFLIENPQTDVADLCHTAAMGRRHYEYRFAAPITSVAGAIGSLQNFAAAQDPMSLSSCDSAKKIGWFFDHDFRVRDFSFARQLYQSDPTFGQSMDHLLETLSMHREQLETGEASNGDWLEGLDQADVAMQFSVQAALAQLWQSWGIEPDVVAGFGAGQYAAACVAGVLAWEDAIGLIVKQLSLGDMADPPNRQAFEAFADQFNYYPPKMPLVCSLSGDMVPVHRSLGGSYWAEHTAAQIDRAGSLATLASAQCDQVMEMGPQSTLESMPQWSDPEARARVLPPATENENVRESMLAMLGSLYVGGVLPDFKSLGGSASRTPLRLPLYPFEKKRYWITEVTDHTEIAGGRETLVDNVVTSK